VKLPKLPKVNKKLEFIILLSIPILIVVSTVVIIVSMLWLFRQKERVGAGEFTDSFEDTSYVDLVNSSNFYIDAGKVQTESLASFGTGNDGDVTISASTNINTTNSISGRSCADGGDAVNYSVTALSSNAATLDIDPSSGCLSVGDEVLLINLAGTTTSIVNLGNYEVLEILDISGRNIYFTADKSNYYGEGESDDSLIGVNNETQRVMLQRVPNYNNLTVNSGITFYPDSWNGSKGGVIFFKVSGTASISGTISAEGKGYRGGAYNAVYGGSPGEGAAMTSGVYGEGGDATNPATSGEDGLWSGGGGAGRYGNIGGLIGGSGSTNPASSGGGGGGSTTRPNTTYNGNGGGGGGGGHATPGIGGSSNGYDVSKGEDGSYTGSGTGGISEFYDSANRGGGGGGGSAMYFSEDLGTLTFGGGGGGGSRGQGSSSKYYEGTSGANGGGIVFISANNVSISGTVTSNGSNADVPVICGGGGGGGAGGSIKIYGDVVSLGTDLVTANGGEGGKARSYGGDGGSGVVAVGYITSISGTSSPSASTGDVPFYRDNMTLVSLDLVSEDSNVSIMSLEYNLSSKPEGTTASIQFSIDGSSWYSSSGILDSSDTLTTGVDNSIDLSGLGWETQEFYYKVQFGTNSGTDTPVLDDITLVYESSPGVPTIGAPEALTTSSIRWNFTDNSSNESGFKLYNLDGVLLDTDETADLSYIDETGLSSNTEYTRKISSYNIVGESDFSSTASAYTLADVPTLETGDVTMSTIGLNAGNTSNLTSDSSGIYFDCAGADCDSGINEWLQTNTDTVTGLSANTQYSFTAKARNGDGVETSNSSGLSKYTLAEQPTISIGEVSVSTVSLSSSGTSNISSGSSGLYFDCIGSGCDVGLNDWLQTSEDVVTGLAPNTEYGFQVKARNGDGVETSYSDSQLIYTYANVPGVPSKSDSTPQSLDLGLDINFNPGNTEFVVYETSNGKYVNKDTGLLQIAPDWGTYSEFVSGGVARVTGLASGTLYQFKVKARNGNNIETVFGTSLSARTKIVISDIPSGLSVNIAGNDAVDLTTDGVDSNSYELRFKKSDLWIADIPIDLTENRNYSDIIVDGEESSNKAVVNLTENHGFSDETFDMYVVKDNTDYVRVCPGAENINQVTETCVNGVDFYGSFPETKSVNGQNVTVKTGSVGDVAYWKIEGLSGTGVIGLETPVCGDGILGNTEGEECEMDNPSGVNCSWSECNQSSCTCPEVLECGDGEFNVAGEECEEGDPEGYECTWSECNHTTCKCPVPQTEEDDTEEDGDEFVPDEGMDSLEDSEQDDEEVSEEPLDLSEEEGSEEVSEKDDIEEEKTGIAKIFADVGSAAGKVVATAAQEVTNFAQSNEEVAGTVAAAPVITSATAVAVTSGVTVVDMPYRFVQFVLGLLQSIGIVRKKKEEKSWGVVYNSVTKEPLSNAVVRLFSEGLLVGTEVTDSNGAFYFAPKRGTYDIKVSRSRFEFPSEIVTGSNDLLRDDIYRGGNLRVVRDGQDISINIPVDPQESSPSLSYLKLIMIYISSIIVALNPVFLAVGITMSLVLYSLTGNVLNLIVVACYLAILAVQLISSLKQKTTWSIVRDEKGRRLSGVKVGVYDKKYKKLIDVRITDNKGRFRFLLPKDEYILKPYKSKYSLVGKNRTGIEVSKKGDGLFFLSAKLVVKK
jgi:hypothetical protein